MFRELFAPKEKGGRTGFGEALLSRWIGARASVMVEETVRYVAECVKGKGMGGERKEIGSGSVDDSKVRKGQGRHRIVLTYDCEERCIVQ